MKEPHQFQCSSGPQLLRIYIIRVIFQRGLNGPAFEGRLAWMFHPFFSLTAKKIEFA